MIGSSEIRWTCYRPSREIWSLFRKTNDRSGAIAPWSIYTTIATSRKRTWKTPGELLRQTVHSLALTSGTEELKVIDPDRTIFAFNLSLWGWKDEDWRRLLKKYPYGLDATESANPSLRARDDQVQRLSQKGLLCHVRGDWLIQELVRLSPQPQTPAWATLSRSEAIQDPVGGYPAQTLDLKGTAAELGLSEGGELEQKLRDEPRLSSTARARPLTPGGRHSPRHLGIIAIPRVAVSGSRPGIAPGNAGPHSVTRRKNPGLLFGHPDPLGQKVMDQKTPSSLLTRLRRGATPADWERFVKLYKPLLDRWVHALPLSDADAENLIQEVFVKLIRKLPSFEYDDARGSFRGLVADHSAQRLGATTVPKRTWSCFRQVRSRRSSLLQIPAADLQEQQLLIVLLPWNWPRPIILRKRSRSFRTTSSTTDQPPNSLKNGRSPLTRST